jgi:uncharacterized membrane protein
MDKQETGRLEAFSDGVFAVAITLLALNIKIPGLDASPAKLYGDTELWEQLRDQWPTLVAYVISFATIGVMWLNHHRLFKQIQRTDTVLLVLNLLLLMVIVFIPVPTALLSEYLPRPDLHAAAILYCFTYFVMACLYNVLWRYAAYENRLLDEKADKKAVQAISNQYLFGPLLYFVIVVFAIFNVPLSIAASGSLVLFFVFPGKQPRV